MTKGWRNEPTRHSLAARGCKTGRKRSNGRYNVDMRTRGIRRHDDFKVLRPGNKNYWDQTEKYGLDPWGGEGPSRHYNPSMYIIIDDVPIEIEAGESDHLTIYKDSEYYYLLTERSSLDYAALTLIDRNTKSVVKSHFFGSINDEWTGIGEDLKKDFFDYSDPYKIKILAGYLDNFE